MDDKYTMTRKENVFLAKNRLAESIYATARLEGVTATLAETRAILEGAFVPKIT